MTQNITTHYWTKASPKLSVLIPYYHDDPSDLLTSLCALSVDAKVVEIIAYDDGTGDAALSQNIEQCLAQLRLPVKVMTATVNKGRAAARNALQDAARAEWLLFLDADMRPMSADFLQNYIDLINTDAADVIFGGFKVEAKAVDADRDLHRALSETSDCLSLEERISAGPQYVATSNLALKKHVITAEPFDPDFSGWGWEDSEWAARIAQTYALKHIDNPALHLGLETTDTLLRRFQTSGPNYVRFTQKHPELAKRLKLYQISSKLKSMPGQKLMRPALRLLVKATYLPMKIRLSALKLWRASWYAEVIS